MRMTRNGSYRSDTSFCEAVTKPELSYSGYLHGEGTEMPPSSGKGFTVRQANPVMRRFRTIRNMQKGGGIPID